MRWITQTSTRGKDHTVYLLKLAKQPLFIVCMLPSAVAHFRFKTIRILTTAALAKETVLYGEEHPEIPQTPTDADTSALTV